MDTATQRGLAPDPSDCHGANGLGQPAVGRRVRRWGPRRRYGWLVLFAPIAIHLWLSSCGGRPAFDAAYLEAQSLFRSGDFRASLEKARLGLRRWPAGDWDW